MDWTVASLTVLFRSFPNLMFTNYIVSADRRMYGVTGVAAVGPREWVVLSSHEAVCISRTHCVPYGLLVGAAPADERVLPARNTSSPSSSSQDPPSLYPAQGWDPVGPIMAIPSCIYVLWLVGWMPSQDLLACFHLNFDGLIPLP
mmetsp:Transcript_6717/g.9333  ORF Transcript_6717/g.9333 Transcript_6717/m.9333 type:complete len:145 (+) Transcript_6717:865-1299(+)